MTDERQSDKDNEERPLLGAMPCPFCDGKTIKTYPGSTFRWRYAACVECGAQAGEVRIETISLPRPEAIIAADKDLLTRWNERAPVPESLPREGATPRTERLYLGIRERWRARGFPMPEDINDGQVHAERLERELADEVRTTRAIQAELDRVNSIRATSGLSNKQKLALAAVAAALDNPSTEGAKQDALEIVRAAFPKSYLVPSAIGRSE